MKVLLTHGYFLDEDPKEREIMRPYPPLGILYLSAYLRQKQVPCEVFDSTFRTKDDMFRHLLKVKPKYVCIYVNLMTKLNVLSIIRFIRNEAQLKGTRIILGGPEVRYHAEQFLKHGATAIVIGEGEETLYDLISTLDTPMNPFLDKVQGIAYMNAAGQMVVTEEREKIKDIDTLPFPDRAAINLNQYFDAWKQKHGQSAVSISTMRGCPYTCKWCSRAVYGLSYRRRSPEKAVEEIAHVIEKFAPDTFWFVDDVFTISHKWLRSFCDALKAKGVTMRYECITRADRLNAEVIAMLKESGCFRVWIGAESGSQRILYAMDRRVTATQVRDMIIETRAQGIQAGTFIMLGYPGETEADIEDTIQHLILSEPDHYTLTVAYPIKGTEFYQEVENRLYDPLPWEQTTDRQSKFKGRQSETYYRHAIRRVYNEVNYHKMKRTSRMRSLPYKLRAILSRTAMRWSARKPS